MSEHPPFFGEHISREQQAEFIGEMLQKYKGEAPTATLKDKIYTELMLLKHEGLVTIPFKVVLENDPTGVRPDYIDVVLETKV